MTGRRHPPAPGARRAVAIAVLRMVLVILLVWLLPDMLAACELAPAGDETAPAATPTTTAADAPPSSVFVCWPIPDPGC